MWRDNPDETRDNQVENVAAEMMMPMLIDACKRLLIDAALIDAGEWVSRDNQAVATGQ